MGAVFKWICQMLFKSTGTNLFRRPLKGFLETKLVKEQGFQKMAKGAKQERYGAKEEGYVVKIEAKLNTNKWFKLEKVDYQTELHSMTVKCGKPFCFSDLREVSVIPNVKEFQDGTKNLLIHCKDCKRCRGTLDIPSGKFEAVLLPRGASFADMHCRGIIRDASIICQNLVPTAYYLDGLWTVSGVSNTRLDFCTADLYFIDSDGKRIEISQPEASLVKK